MPQMSPIWWFSLFLVFTMILILTNSLNYFYSKNSIPNKMNTYFLNKHFTWKW